jgi:hypothetical protein
MANNPDFLKNTGIWEDFVEHQEAFDRVQQELNEEYQRDGSTTSTTQQHETKQDGERKHPTEQEAFDRVQQELNEEYQRDGSTTSTTQQHETKQDGERKHPTEHEYEDGKNTTEEQEPRSNNRQDTAPVTPHIHNVPTKRQTETTSKIPHPQKNTDPIDLTISPKHLSQSPSDNINTPNRRPNTPPPKTVINLKHFKRHTHPGSTHSKPHFCTHPQKKQRQEQEEQGCQQTTPPRRHHTQPKTIQTPKHTLKIRRNRKTAHHATQKQTPKI